MINAAIVGIGNWGQLLVSSVQNNSSVTFTKGVTRTKSKAVEFCATNNIEIVDDYDTLLADPSIDAIVLATPHTQHAGRLLLRRKLANMFLRKNLTPSASPTRKSPWLL